MGDVPMDELYIGELVNYLYSQALRLQDIGYRGERFSLHAIYAGDSVCQRSPRSVIECMLQKPEALNSPARLLRKQWTDGTPTSFLSLGLQTRNRNPTPNPETSRTRDAREPGTTSTSCEKEGRAPRREESTLGRYGFSRV